MTGELSASCGHSSAPVGSRYVLYCSTNIAQISISMELYYKMEKLKGELFNIQEYIGKSIEIINKKKKILINNSADGSWFESQPEDHRKDSNEEENDRTQMILADQTCRSYRTVTVFSLHGVSAGIRVRTALHNISIINV